MVNKDLMKQQNAKIMEELTKAMQEEDETKMSEAFTAFAEGVQQSILNEYEDLRHGQDKNILSNRGIRQLTTEETKFYQSWIDANNSTNPKQALVDLDKAMPETIMDEVIKEMAEQHELLSTIDFINCKGAIKMIVNAGNIELATWDALTTTIATELAGKIDTMDLTLAKLSAFIPVSKDMLDLGVAWIDKYTRTILIEATSAGLEKAIIKGDGKNKPIGMCKDLDGAVKAGVYADKTKVKLDTLDPVAFCGVIAPLAEKPLGGYRSVQEVIFIVNPIDYIQKILPSSTVRASDGTYKNNVFPYPTKTIQSSALEKGEAIIGIANKYFMGVGAGKSGKIEYSDEYQFLEDNRVYLTKLYGMGKPKDNKSFIYLDITEMKPQSLRVEVTNTEEKPVNTKSKTA